MMSDTSDGSDASGWRCPTRQNTPAVTVRSVLRAAAGCLSQSFLTSQRDPTLKTTLAVLRAVGVEMTADGSVSPISEPCRLRYHV